VGNPKSLREANSYQATPAGPAWPAGRKTDAGHKLSSGTEAMSEPAGAMRV
jgi:hypothetical protein